ncbi:MAG TPA: dicarboxylate/amino acid:cation symporter [Hellea balneolensis]|uniref:Dicarboxylate/amino acid:cation symporter n=1 Tax=Hellea balneolensis TaxID=287478 RepID=A0A7C5LSH0_9PROT|nr:dicarboxylate/amino acid:cation symporter [Hellea balneolensis]
MLQTWRAMTLWKRVFIGLFFGIAIGLGLHYGLGETGKKIAETWFKPFGDAFVSLIRMLIVPLIVTTLVSGMVAMGDARRLGSLGIRTVFLYLLTTFFAVWLGLAVATLFQPGAGLGELISAGNSSVDTVAQKLSKAGAAQRSVSQYLLDIIPRNPIKAMVDGDMLAIIFFSIIIGVGVLLSGEKGKLVGDFFDSASEVVMKVTMMIMNLAPYGVLALMAWVMGVNGLGILVNMSKLAIALYLACILQIVFVYGGLIIRTILRLPVVRYFYGIADAAGVAFSTSSSSATLPVTISCAEKNLGVEKSVAGSVLPMGATVNMDGTAIYLGIVALFAAQAFNLDLNLGVYLMVALTATLASIGTAGIPSASLFLAVGMLQSIFGIEESQAILIVAFIFPFDRLLDMMRTVTNIAGDVAVACTVAKWEGQLDEEVFKTKSVV